VTFPHSLGIFYTALTQYLGFLRYGDEYKVMGLASYGEPEYLDEFRKIVAMPANGLIGFRLDFDYFLHHKAGVAMTWAGGEPSVGRLYSDYLVERLGKARETGEDVEQSLIKQRLLRDIPYGHVPDLFELTKITHKAIHADLEHVISKIVDPGKSDYALITGIQIHGPENNYVWPGVCYAVVQGTKRNLTL